MDNLRIDGLSGLLSSLGALPEDIGRELEEVVDRGSEVALQSLQREADKTYRRSIPTSGEVYAYNKRTSMGEKVKVKKKSIGTGGGKPAWERSGNLREQLTISRPSRFVREIGSVGSSEAYAGRLKELPTGALGINRSNDLFGVAYTRTATQLPVIAEQGVKNVLSRLR